VPDSIVAGCKQIEKTKIGKTLLGLVDWRVAERIVVMQLSNYNYIS
jgi:hypothetical protein